MTDTTTLEAASDERPRRSGSLSALRLAELQGLASSMGIAGTAKMRKGDLVAAITSRQNGESGPASTGGRPARRNGGAATTTGEAGPAAAQDHSAERPEGHEDLSNQVERRAERHDDTAVAEDRVGGERQNRRDRNDGQRDRQQNRGGQGGNQQGQGNQGNQGNQGGNQQGQGNQGGNQQGQGNQGNQNNQGANNGPRDDDDSRSGRRRRNRNRSRDKRRTGQPQVGGDFDAEPQIAEDDVLVPVAGILDVLDSYAFVRTSGYLPGSNDVYVPLNVVRRNGLRKGDAVTGAVKAAGDGEEPQQQTVGGRNNRQKYNPLARLDTVNGMTTDEARKRPEFGKLTPLYPQERLRLETEQSILTTRIIDLVAPIGKGQRGLIVAPAKAGKTMVMQAIANAITMNNPECHLMVVLVDERPEEVTDMQRAVKGEVISSTFDRPAEDHTTVAELSIERAKRLVEMGHDVVVLLDSITKLGRAYNLAAPASGRILSGGVDSAALYPPKKFFGAARNIEHGGSLTILATALVETGSRMDEVIFEEFKGTGNMELKLDRQLANRRIFPAVDVNNSGTRKEEILLAPEELKIMWKLRRVLAALDSQQGIELLLDRLRKTKNNFEFLTQVQQTSAVRLDEDGD